MQELFSIEGKRQIDPNGLWTKGDFRIYEWFCCSKKHTFVNPEMARNCCRPAEIRILDKGWVEKPIFDMQGEKIGV